MILGLKYASETKVITLFQFLSCWLFTSSDHLRTFASDEVEVQQNTEVDRTRFLPTEAHNLPWFILWRVLISFQCLPDDDSADRLPSICISGSTTDNHGKEEYQRICIRTDGNTDGWTKLQQFHSCMDSWVQCRSGGKTRLSPAVLAGRATWVKPEPDKQNWSIEVLPALRHHTVVQERQAAKGVGQPEPPQSVFFLSLFHTCTKKSLNFNTLSICGSYWQFKLYYSVYWAEKSPA